MKLTSSTRMRRIAACRLLLIVLGMAPLRIWGQQGGGATTPQVPTPASNPTLRQELLRLGQRDQEARVKVLEWMGQQHLTDIDKVKRMGSPPMRKLHQVDRADTARLKEIIARYGWPGKALAGGDGANAAWLLAQHADEDRMFQKQCLLLMEKAVMKGDASCTDLAYLTDRVLMGEKRKQRYGTQVVEQSGRYVPYPIEDEASVDKRRAQVGLRPLATYLKEENEFYEGAGRGRSPGQHQ